MKKIKAMLAQLVLLVVSGVVAPSLSVSAQEELTIVWYPNESGADLESSREQISTLISEATGKTVKKLNNN